MKTKSLWLRALSLFIAFLLAMPIEAMAQSGDDGGSRKLSKEELAQLLAPIALYPDELVTQILMASTYPVEIVQADRWVQNNKGLKGDALAKALENQTWDPSVKSLVNFPDVLSAMSQKLDLTSKVGDAFLSQQQDVMETIQELRNKAYQSGNLKSTKEQKVVVEKETIVIQPSNPQVVYVPAYNPTVVYGAWPYPSYPPYAYYPPPAGYAFTFAAGVALGAAWGYAWGHSDWHGGNVNINYNQNNNFNRNIDRNKYKAEANRQGQRGNNWQHDPSHRKGAAYKDGATAKKFGQSPSRSAAARAGTRDARGYGAGGRTQGGRPSAGTMDRGGAAGAGRGGAPGAGAGVGRGGATGAGAGAGGARGGRDSAFSGGYGSGRQERMASDRGQASRQSAGLSSRSGGGFGGASASRPSGGFGGGSRGGFGGGGRGGGGGRRR